MRPALSLRFVSIALTAAALLAGCSSSSAPPISVTVSPSSAQTDQGFTVSINATLVNDSKNLGLAWTLSGPGSLSNQTNAGVTYNAPQPSNSASPQSATITATSVADTTKTAVTQITVNPLPQITTLNLAGGNLGSAYSQTVSETGGTQPFTWAIAGGGLPFGLNIASGTISGTPTGGGTWYFDVQLVDAVGAIAEQGFLSISITSNNAPGNPVPFLNQALVPTAAAPGGSAFTLAVNGTGFVQGATVNFNSSALATTFVNSRQLTALVPSANIATATTASISIVNPAPGGGRSNVVFFPVSTPTAGVNFSNANGSPITGIPSPISLAVGDFTAQGKPDLAAVSFTNTFDILLAQGDGTFTLAPGSPILVQKPPYNTFPSQYPDYVALGYFDPSGNLGLAVTDYGTFSVSTFQGDGHGRFTQSTASVFTGDSPGTVGVGDFLGNGNSDLAIANALGVLNVQQGYGDGAFNSLPAPEDDLNGVASVVVGDFNNDGKLDLAITANINQSLVLVYLGNGDGTFTLAPNSPFTAGGGPTALVAADFNGDGVLDLAVVNEEDNTVSILLGNGDGSFALAPGSPITVGSGPDAIAVGDLNSDGHLDLAIANTGENTVTILLGNGDGTFTPAPSSPITVGSAPIAVAIGDFNSSGRLGLAVANLFDNTISILVQQ
jgi:FG-GAP-like repeat